MLFQFSHHIDEDCFIFCCWLDCNDTVRVYHEWFLWLAGAWRLHWPGLERHLTKTIRSLHRKWINPSKSLAKASEVGDFRISDVCIWFVMGSVWTGLQMALRRVHKVQLVLLRVDMSRLCWGCADGIMSVEVIENARNASAVVISRIKSLGFTWPKLFPVAVLTQSRKKSLYSWNCTRSMTTSMFWPILIQPASAEIVSRVVLVWAFGPKWLWFYDQELEPYFNNCLGKLISQQCTLFYIILYGDCWLFWYILIASINSLRKIEDGKKNKRSRSRSRQRSPPPKRDRPGVDGRCW